MAETKVLGHAELERLAAFLLDRIDQDTRHQLMAELPVTYVKLFPTVAVETIVHSVRSALVGERKAQRQELAEKLDLATA